MSILLTRFVSILVVREIATANANPANGVRSQDDATAKVNCQLTGVPKASAAPIAAPMATCDRLIGSLRRVKKVIMPRLESATASTNAGSVEDTIPEDIAWDSLFPSRSIPARSPIEASRSACGYRSAPAPTEVPRQVERLLAPRITHNAKPVSTSRYIGMAVKQDSGGKACQGESLTGRFVPFWLPGRPCPSGPWTCSLLRVVRRSRAVLVLALAALGNPLPGFRSSVSSPFRKEGISRLDQTLPEHDRSPIRQTIDS